MKNLKSQHRLIFAGVFFLISFVGFLFFGTAIKYSLFISIIISLVILYFTDPEVQRREAERMKRLRRDRDITHEEYIRARSREKAKYDEKEDREREPYDPFKPSIDWGF